MTTADSALSKNPFSVDPSACFRSAETLRLYARPEELLPWTHLPPAQQLSFKIAFISICHKFNWDFLQNRLAEILLLEPEEIARTLQNVTARDVKAWLSDYPKQERVRAAERAKFLRDVGEVLASRWQGNADRLYQDSQGELGGESGFFALLEHFAAFREDPLRKKSQILVHDLVRENIVEFSDSGQIEPAVDYHLIRIYLRSGRVVRKSKILDQFLTGSPDPRPRFVRLLRETVAEAAKLTAHYAGISIPDLNYIEWQLGREICVSGVPDCDLEKRPNFPDDIEKIVGPACPYRDFCEAYNQPTHVFLNEPIFEKSYY